VRVDPLEVADDIEMNSARLNTGGLARSQPCQMALGIPDFHVAELFF